MLEPPSQVKWRPSGHSALPIEVEDSESSFKKPSTKKPKMDVSKKKTSRDAARQRRGQQNDEYSEIALQLPLPMAIVEKLDRLCVMRLSSSYIKIKHILHEIEDGTREVYKQQDFSLLERSCISFIQTALGGFVFVLAEDGQCLYVSPNVSEFLGLQQLDLTGHSIYKYVHPCDQESLAQQLGGHAPLADMEIFDGLFCTDTPPHIEKPPKPAKKVFESSSHRSFFLRMKSTLTSRGKSVNINASIHRVVQCTGTMQMYRMRRGISSGSITRCFIGIGTPLLSNTTFEVPIDNSTFITKHALDMKLISIEEIGSNILGYPETTLKNKSWYAYCHACDIDVLKECHDAVIQKGQSISAYYRIMVQHGGWIWMQTTANVVYSSSTRLPTYIICTQYVISGVESDQNVLSLVQQQKQTVINKKKRRIAENKKDKKDDEMKEEWSPPMVKLKTEASSPVYEYNLPKVVNVKHVYPSGDAYPLGGGSTGGGSTERNSTHFLDRAPWIPFPNQDAKIDFSSLDDDRFLFAVQTTSAAVDFERTPNVPDPTIDKIFAFEDLPFPDLSENYQDLEFDDDSMTGSSADSIEALYNCDDFQELLNASVIPQFLFKPDVAKETTPDVVKGTTSENDGFPLDMINKETSFVNDGFPLDMINET